MRSVLDRLAGAEPHLTLLSDAQSASASKVAIRMALEQIARQATPNDTFVMSFSGHGYTDRNGHFYILPSDFAGQCSGPSEESALSTAISSDEIAQWLRAIDAGQMVVILDTCYSAASVDDGNFKPGPLGNAGLGQLAYDKRMRILTASQADQKAEKSTLGAGLLTYSLVSGLNQGSADRSPKDGKIYLREWLRYAVQYVPQLYKQKYHGKVAGQIGQTPDLFDFNQENDNGPLLSEIAQ